MAMAATLSQQYNVGEKHTVMLYTYILIAMPSHQTKQIQKTKQYILVIKKVVRYQVFSLNNAIDNNRGLGQQVFLPRDHGLDFLHQLSLEFSQSINQSISTTVLLLVHTGSSYSCVGDTGFCYIR